MCVKMNLSYFFLLLFAISNISALDLDKLTTLGITGSVYISDIAVYFNKAFLAIPRTICNNNVTHPTLVEVPWKELNVILKSRFNKPIEDQIWAKCDDLQNAISLAKEGAKSKLWILDKGNEFCPPKILAYNMFHNSFLNEEKIELADVPKSSLQTIVIENEAKFGDHRAFIANPGDNKILVCYLNSLNCQHLNILSEGNSDAHRRVNFLSISKVDDKMFMTSTRSMEVYYLNLKQVAADYEEQNTTELTIPITLCGETLGPSSALETDLRNGLIYYLTRDYAIVRWSTDKPMKAEHHDVLTQSIKTLPYVSRLFTDPQGNIVALTNLFDPYNCLNETDQFTLDRAVRIIKYSWILDTFI